MTATAQPLFALLLGYCCSLTASEPQSLDPWPWAGCALLGVGWLCPDSNGRRLSLDYDENIYVADSGNHLIRRLPHHLTLHHLTVSLSPSHCTAASLALLAFH